MDCFRLRLHNDVTPLYNTLESVIASEAKPTTPKSPKEDFRPPLGGRG